MPFLVLSENCIYFIGNGVENLYNNREAILTDSFFLPIFNTGVFMGIAKIDPKKKIRTVSAEDDAIDKENSDMEKFEKTHNIEYLQFKKDVEPTYFMIGNLTSSQQAEIQEKHYEVVMPTPEQLKADKDAKPMIKQSNQTQMLIKYFEYGCQSYEESKKDHPCNADTFPFPIVQELGSYIMVRTALGDDEKKLLES